MFLLSYNYKELRILHHYALPPICGQYAIHRECTNPNQGLLNLIKLDSKDLIMKNSDIPIQFKSLARKISLAELVILLILIFMWISTFYLMHTQRQKHVEKMISLQEKILALSSDQLKTGMATRNIAWPFTDIFGYVIFEDTTIIASNIEWLAGNNLTIKEAFGKFIHAPEMMKQLRMDNNGTAWIRLNKLSPKEWMSWQIIEESPYTITIISNEDKLLGISGYHGHKLLLLICACLFSALLLLALIWALSWLRLSAVRELQKNL